MEYSFCPITLVIPTLNRDEDLKTTLESFLAQPTLPQEIIVVDQSNDDAHRKNREIVQAIAKKTSLMATKILRLETRSLTAARNKGLVLAKNDIVVFSDDDIVVCANVIESLFKIMQSQDYAMVGALDKNTRYAGSSVRVIASCLTGRKAWRQRKIGCVTKSVYGTYPYEAIRQETETRWAMGYFFVIKKTLAQKWSLSFDENLSAYAYAEDLDFTYRYWSCASSEGMKCIISPSIVVSHLASLRARPNPSEMFLRECINRLYLCYKLFRKNPLARLSYYWANFCTSLRYFGKKSYVPWRRACKAAWHYRKQLKSGVIFPEMYLSKKRSS